MIDLCPTGARSMPLEEMHDLPLAVWMAVNRHLHHALGRPGIAAIFEEALADIEVMGLLKQAEAALGGPSVLPQTPFSAPGVLSGDVPDQVRSFAPHESPELRTPVPENNKQTEPANNKTMTIIHITRLKPLTIAETTAPQTPTPAPEAAQASHRSTPAFGGAQPAPATAQVKVNPEAFVNGVKAADTSARLLFLSAECLRLTELLEAANRRAERAQFSARLGMVTLTAVGELFRKQQLQILAAQAENTELKGVNATLLKALHRAETAVAASQSCGR